MTIIYHSLILLFISLPLQFALSPREGIDLAVLRLVILIIFTYLVAHSLFKRTFFVPIGWHVALFFIFAMYALLSLLYSPQPLWTLRKIAFLFSIFPLYFILMTIFAKIKNAHIHMCRAVVYGGTIAALIGIIQFVLQFIFPLNTIIALWSRISPFFLGGTFSTSVSTYNSWLVHVGGHDLMRAVGFFPDPHVFSFYLGLIIPLAGGLYFKTRQKKWLFIAVLLICGDLLTLSRGGYVALLGGCIIGTALLWHRLHTSLRHALFACALSVTMLFAIPHNPITQRFFSSFDSMDTSNTHRIFLWKQACEKISQKPLFGVGLGAYPSIIDPTADYRTPIYAHNLFLDVTAELGIIGGLLFFSIYTYSFSIFYKNKNDFLALFAIISISIFLIHALFDTPLFSVHVLPVLIFIFALAAYYESTGKTQ